MKRWQHAALWVLAALCTAEGTARAGEPDESVSVTVAAQVPRLALKRFRRGEDLITAARVFGNIGAGTEVAGLSLGLINGLKVQSRDLRTASLALAWSGPALDLVSFSLEAAGIGEQHAALASLGGDPGSGLFAAGTTFGVLGMLALGAGLYFSAENDSLYSSPFGSSGLNVFSGNDVAVLGCLMGSAILLTIEQQLFAADHRRTAEEKARLRHRFE